MMRRTYKNVVKATKMIVGKGYEWKEANKIAIQCFDNAEQNKNGMPIEWYINKIADKKEWEAGLKEYTKFKNKKST